MYIGKLAEVNTVAYGFGMITPNPKRRLAKTDWVQAGFRALVQTGPAGLKVEALAREIGTTKGSFYWHFKDIAALQIEMLVTWEELATLNITAAVKRSGLSPVKQLRLLVDMVSEPPDSALGGPAVEPAIRDWGRINECARSTLERVDRRRLSDLREFFVSAGANSPDRAATSLYAAVIGLENLRLTVGQSMREPLHCVLDDLLR